MRKILFKAKRIDNGEWVEGDLLHTRCDDIVLISDYKDHAFRCDANTICQYTGYTDNNGRKIWENDIVDTFEESSKEILRNVVKFKDGCFKVFKKHYLSMYLDSYEKTDLKAVGNIFDALELLKED